MKPRVGKIARLPAHIRDELNHRLAQGALAKDIVAWLNDLPEVQKIMADLFHGARITHQNISVWRYGGHTDWTSQRTDRAQWQDLFDHLEELNHKCTLPGGVDVTNHLATLVVFELSQALDKLGRMKDSDERWRIFRTLSRSLSRLRMDKCRENRIRLWDLKAARDFEQCKPMPTYATLKKDVFF